MNKNIVVHNNCVLTGGTIGDKLHEYLMDDLKSLHESSECITLPINEATIYLNRY